MNLLERISKKILSFNSITSKLKEDFNDIEEDYYNEIFDDIQVDGRAIYDNLSEHLDIEVDYMEIIASDFVEVIKAISDQSITDDEYNEVRKDSLELVMPLINKTIKLKSSISTFDFHDRDLKNTEIELEIIPKSFKYSYIEDKLIMEKFEIKNYYEI